MRKPALLFTFDFLKVKKDVEPDLMDYGKKQQENVKVFPFKKLETYENSTSIYWNLLQPRGSRSSFNFLTNII